MRGIDKIRLLKFVTLCFCIFILLFFVSSCISRNTPNELIENSKLLASEINDNGKLLASGSDDGTVRLWEIETGELLKTFNGHSDNVNSVSFSPDGKLLVSGSDDKAVKLWDIETGRLLKTLIGHSDSVDSVIFYPDSRILVSGSKDSTIRFWNIETGKTLKVIKSNDYHVSSMSFSPNCKILVLVCSDKTIKLWDIYTERVIKTLHGHSGYVRSVSFSPDGKILASGSDDYTVKLWNTETGELLKTLIGNPNSVSSVSFLQAPNILPLSVSQNAMIKLWDLETDKEIRRFHCLYHRGAFYSHFISSLRFSPDGKILASGIRYFNFMDKEQVYNIELWDTKRGELLKTLEGLSGNVTSISFYPEINQPALINDGKQGNLFYKKTDTIETKSPDQEDILKGESLPKIVEHIFSKQKNWAVVIGIKNYDSKNGFQPLKYGINDALNVRNYLTDYLNFPKEQVISLLDSNATKANIEKLLGDDLPNKVKKDDRVFIYFSGHGTTKQSKNKSDIGYIVPFDGDKNSINATSIPMSTITYLSKLIPAKHIIFIFDSCFSGLAGITYKSNITKETKELIKQWQEDDSVYALTAGTSKENAIMSDDLQMSLYTYYLLEGLKGRADYDENKVISLNELQSYLEIAVPKGCNNSQHPKKFLLKGEGMFVFYRQEE